MEEGRQKVAAKGDVTQMAVNGSRSSVTEAEIRSADVDDRRVTNEAASAGRDGTRNLPESEHKQNSHR